MVLVDTATELLYEVLHRFPRKELEVVIDGVYLETINHLREECGYTDKEWDRMLDGIQKSRAGSHKEDTRTSGRWLASKGQFEKTAMGGKPLSVIKCDLAGDYRKIFDEGVRRGNGTEEDRNRGEELVKGLEWFNDELVAAQLRLSTSNVYVKIQDCGHDLPMRRPAVIVEAVKWALERVTNTCAQ